MNWIKTFFQRVFSRDNLIILGNTLLLFVVLNCLFVYFSPVLIKSVPPIWFTHSSSCYRTLFHMIDAPKATGSELEVVFGDSYSEGAGDEYLSGQADYGMFNKLKEHPEQVVIFGRSGYGNKGPVVEEERCGKLLSTFTSFDYDRENVSRVTFMFYEGNDLNNNLREKNRRSKNARYTFNFFTPLLKYVHDNIKSQFEKDKDRDRGAATGRQDFPTSRNGIKIEDYPQSAAVELSAEETSTALGVLEQSIEEINKRYPHAKKQFLYLPSVVSSYEFDGPLKVQSYKDKPFFETDGATNRQRSDEIRRRIKEMIDGATGWKFCDATPDVLALSSKGQAVHGPKDWQHFNQAGYTAALEAYQRCFGDK